MIKRTKNVLLVMLSGVILIPSTISCNSDDSSISNVEVVETDLRTTSSSTVFHDKLWEDISLALSENKSTLTEERAYQILKPAIPHSLSMLRDYGFSNLDLAEMLEISEREAQDINTTNIYSLSRDMQLRIVFAGHKVFIAESLRATANSNQVVDCFLEATGIAAGVAIIGALGNQALSRTAVIGVIKQAATKIGTRTLGFIGLGLMAAEFIWCMNR